MRFSAGLVLAAGAAFGQAPAAVPAFEVAAIKPSGPLDPGKIASGQMKIGLKITGARVEIGSFSLADLIRTAYKLKAYQLSGPGWMGVDRFDVQAKLPEGATAQQVPEMLQALLAERFKLAVHRETKEHSVYGLVVGKNGHKLKEPPPDADAPIPESAPGSGGLTVGVGTSQVRVTGSMEGKGVTISGGPTGSMRMSMVGGMMRMEATKINMAALAEMLTRFLDRPVVDMTELKGIYQASLEISMEDLKSLARTAGVMIPGGPSGGKDGGKSPADVASEPSGLSIFASVQQLGLKLEPRKAPIEMIVIDHLEKAPTEN